MEFSCDPIREFGGTMGYCKFSGLTPLTLYQIKMIVNYPRGELDAEISGTTAMVILFTSNQTWNIHLFIIWTYFQPNISRKLRYKTFVKKYNSQTKIIIYKIRVEYNFSSQKYKTIDTVASWSLSALCQKTFSHNECYKYSTVYL